MPTGSWHTYPQGVPGMLGQSHIITPIYGGDLAHLPRSYGYRESLHTIYVLNSPSLNRFKPFKDVHEFGTLFGKERSGKTPTMPTINDMVASLVREIKLASSPMVSHVSEKEFAVMVMTSSPGKITDGDMGFLVPRPDADQSQFYRFGPSFVERLNGD